MRFRSGLLLCLCLYFSAESFAETMKSKPNILFFFTDDQRFDTIHALGNEAIHTPNMDRLAERGTAFTRAHVMGGTSPAVCMPSRAMLHTGRSLFGIEAPGQVIDPDYKMLGEVLRENGYQTFGLGKWHNREESFNRAFADGDEIYFGGMCDHWNVPAHRYDPTGRYDGRIPMSKDPMTTNEVIWRSADHIQPGTHSSELLADGAVRFLQDYAKEDPFFLYLSFLAPHDPRTMPEKYRRMYDPAEIELPPNFMGGHPFDNGALRIRDEKLEAWPRTPEAIRKHIAEYYAMITHMDAEMGRVLEALEACGETEDTIIVLAGDNGLALGQHGLMGKQNLYDHSVRVPLVMAGPGIPAGGRSDALCYLYDIYPTLCQLAELPIPETVEGRSLVPAFEGATVRERLMLAYCHQMRGVRDDRFKLIETVVDDRRTTQLFDLKEDPWELENLAGDPLHEKRLEALRSRLETFPDEHNDIGEQGRTFWDGYENASVVRVAP